MAQITWSLTSAQQYHNTTELTACIVSEVIKWAARLLQTEKLTPSNRQNWMWMLEVYIHGAANKCL